MQAEAGIELIPESDFAWYDHVLNTSMLVGAIPSRHYYNGEVVGLDTLFRIGRGQAPSGCGCSASEMTKWFNTNYLYIVPELVESQKFELSWYELFEQVTEAQKLGYKVKPVLLGPVTYLFLSKCSGEAFDKLALLARLLPVNQQVLVKLAGQDVEWVQIDESAFREGMPLKVSQWKDYLNWATYAFRISASGVKDETYTHMCYSDFNNIISAIAEMDANVITIETSRSDMALLDAFEHFEYPNGIGPGVYDIHTPNVPEIMWIKALIHKTAKKFPCSVYG
ncbi:hypothetical protein N478_21585 [Pseudoalteromonas luteoviolacea S4060-1]|uniref:Cobalamin-independent methionine synthase MetE N-terminal domain-containing protein n=1 Tax=Pseudoalteromonas luteoviolacea S4060-1 TaxID=1365257 RepID=A0A167LW64_9GAMM|nr:hypothetical protein N478_21585 [Pseudoalteromonas luteoviolacea S4060-1]